MTTPLLTTAIRHTLVVWGLLGGLPFALANEPPPPGSRPGRSIFVGEGQAFSPNQVRIKVVDQPKRKTIYIWSPPSRQGSVTVIYSGSCLLPGCVFMNNTGYAYPHDRSTLKYYSINKFTLGDWMYELD